MVSIMVLALAAELVSRSETYEIQGPMRRPPSARLLWEEKFRGDRLSPRDWSFETAFNKEGWFNHELQYYSNGQPTNLRVGNNELTIQARKEDLDPAKFPDWGGQHYTSARIISTRSWRYGFFEIRAKLPCGRGTWPAIWMLPKSMQKWPDDGEIDIMEQVGAEPNMIYATLHTGRYNHVLGTQRGAHRLSPSSCTAFHRYQLDWRPDSIVIGFDDTAMLKVLKEPSDRKPEWPFDQPFRLILNLAIGGDWGGAKGIDDSALPQQMVVDYVRVWQANQASGTFRARYEQSVR